MISVRQLIFGLLVCVVLLVAIAIIGVWGYWTWKRHREEAVRIQKLETSVSALTVAAGSLTMLPQYVAGYEKVAAQMVTEITRFREAVAIFSKLIVRPEDTAGLSLPSEGEKDMAFSLQQLLQAHPDLNRDQARQMLDSSLQTDEVASLGAGIE